MRSKTSLVRLILLALVATVAVACGGDDATTSPVAAGTTHEEETLTPAEAAPFAANIERLLGQARDAYEAGNAEGAGELVAEAYLSNYELLEHTVEEADHDLNEELEALMGTELRAKIKEGAPATEIAQMIDEALDLLAQGMKALENAA